MSKKSADPGQFEQSIQELEHIVQQLEQGELSLEQALGQFERGISLVKHSQQQLHAAEQKVQILLQQQPEPLQPFEPQTGD
ncbi:MULTISPECIES: exodeoxyribonuclease VII small subunit [Gammaproteobacteria]|uniref:exodeoxyribonuclease VII small subunit n=1 Tax=Gammaproteobacteria TaxID=1236 RepID=UPI001E42FDFE|nr:MULTISPECIES: exodeoxyribonuclease VII small subunit [Gammaproteobacteria]MDP4946303.1 exodeoxyribonuclease VII small subunit [Alishewanella sp.]MDP5206265.1 exodeoxyribonuclease VII small subunit [Alishewanella sp. SMS9]MCC5450960.1 exodeoxyribonuclease VII small subunit [Rheinheimera sp. UJ51]MCF4007973.1 exodeoxyribonuclease VII small subunit [Rheinheimera sp. UJ63]MDP5037066.1 exodeoxyribonuclease VII small subunit [Alishewanella sp.]